LLVNISPSEPVIQRGPCASGEHTRDILRELGYSAGEVEAMEDERAVLDGSK
jgi:crotonobetainyl-CoA:carnitine CoA-transferase CaiB-like acyl-CoA transferase